MPRHQLLCAYGSSSQSTMTRQTYSALTTTAPSLMPWCCDDFARVGTTAAAAAGAGGLQQRPHSVCSVCSVPLSCVLQPILELLPHRDPSTLLRDMGAIFCHTLMLDGRPAWHGGHHELTIQLGEFPCTWWT